MKEKVYSLSFYGETYNVVLRKGSYHSNKTLAVEIVEKHDDGTEEDFGTLTVNISASDVLANNTNKAFIDTNNLGEKILTWLVDNGIAKSDGYSAPSGYCYYPLVTFNDDVMKNMRGI